MKKRNFIFALLLFVGFGAILPAYADDKRFLQEIQDQLTQVSAVPGRRITVIVTDAPKRIIALTPTSISLSHGFLKQMTDIHQLVATMAHMTAHISLDYVARPPLPEDRPEDRPDGQKSSALTAYIKSSVRPEYPDESNIPQATGAFHREGATIIERPGYQNKDYGYTVNRADIIATEHEREVDKTTDKILRHGGFCPSDYSRLLHYFYENPQRLLGNRHFALDADQWPRLDAADRRADPAITCAPEQMVRTQNFAGAFDQLKIKLALAKK